PPLLPNHVRLSNSTLVTLAIAYGTTRRYIDLITTPKPAHKASITPHGPPPPGPASHDGRRPLAASRGVESGYNEPVRPSSDVIEALVTGQHGDPFSVLGPHPDGDERLTVRAFLPEARTVAVVPRDGSGTPHPLRPVHPAGLWEGTLPAALRAYQLRVTDHEGRVSELEDPYRFPSTLSDYDLHLL